MVDNLKVANAANSVKWFVLENGKIGFRGVVGGLPRMIVDDDMPKLAGMLARMAESRA